MNTPDTVRFAGMPAFFDHIKTTTGHDVLACGAVETGYLAAGATRGAVCTLPRGHEGDHEAAKAGARFPYSFPNDVPQ